MLDQGIFSCVKEFACQGNSLLQRYPKILCIIKTSYSLSSAKNASSNNNLSININQLRTQ